MNSINEKFSKRFGSHWIRVKFYQNETENIQMG